MLIPIKCFTCNFLISPLYRKYQALIEQNVPADEIFKELRIKRYCCKKIFLTHCDMTKILNKDK